jgi:hypothetical protein
MNVNWIGLLAVALSLCAFKTGELFGIAKR